MGCTKAGLAAGSATTQDWMVGYVVEDAAHDPQERREGDVVVRVGGGWRKPIGR